MRVSVCLTVFNEEGSIEMLLKSLLQQSRRPDEIVIVDGGSQDKTVEIAKEFQKKHKSIKLKVKKSNRAEGRNLSVKSAKNDIIAITDADCIAEPEWLKRITEPFNDKEVEIVAGFYKMKVGSPFQMAESIFLGVMASQFDDNFLPSTRSIAFRKSIWKKIGGFPEGESNSAEDTDFNYQAVKLGVKYARVKNALVVWSIPESLGEYIQKAYSYALWDGRYGVWWHPVQRLRTHNIRALLVVARYALGVALFFVSTNLFVLVVALYVYRSFMKVFKEYKNKRAGLWGIVIQISTDFAVGTGFLRGLLHF